MRYEKELTLRQKIIAIISVGLLLTALSYVTNGESGGSIENGVLVRPEPGEDAVSYDIDVKSESGDSITTTNISVEARVLADEELETYYEQAVSELERDMLLDNSSLDDVRSKLNLMDELCDGIFSVNWYSDDYEVINYDGAVYNDEFDDDEERMVTLTAVVSYESEDRQYTYELKVHSPIRDEDESLRQKVLSGIARALSSTSKENEVALPDSYGGVSVHYEETVKRELPIFLILSIVAAVAVVYEEKNKIKVAEADRIKQMTYDYSEVVSKLTLLMGAGMTVRRAWSKIVDDYTRNKDVTGVRHIYEEMYEALSLIESGVPEVAAYERFGRKCNTKEYLKLSSLLQTNVKKGTKELALLLEREAFEAFEQRKNLAKQKGEEATTKLLVPMIMMLVIVMAIVMVPAIEGFMV